MEITQVQGALMKQQLDRGVTLETHGDMKHHGHGLAHYPNGWEVLMRKPLWKENERTKDQSMKVK